MYPLCVLGSIFGDYAYTSTADRHRFIIGPAWSGQVYMHNTWVVTPGNSYLIKEGSGDVDYPKIVPYNDFYDGLGVVDFTDNSEVLLTPAYVRHQDTTRSEVYLDLDGVVHAMADGIQSEDTVTFGGKVHRLFQNIFRTTYYDFMGVADTSIPSTTTTTTTTTTT